VPNEQLQLMKMMQQIVADSMAPMMAKVSEVADRQDAFERRASMPPADIGAGEVSVERRAQRLAGLHGADNLSANAPEPEQSGPEKPIVRFTDEHAEAMMPRDYQHGYRAGQKAKFCLCITPAED
jgi:hypothetical protein